MIVDRVKHIDGLRAVSVIAVIMLHAGVSWIPGGYLGVDIFFAISGYVIGKTTYNEIRNNKFQVVDFYLRRARRLLPALYTVVIATMVVGWIVLLPYEFESLAENSVATVLSANNILLYLTFGYWDLRSELKPLLHTWSLGVEEQFYLIWPILLYILIRIDSSQKKVYFLALIASISLVLSFAYQNIDRMAAFYLLPFRAWEILVGAIGAIVDININKKPLIKKILNCLAPIGLLVILLLFVISQKDAHLIVNIIAVFAATIIILGGSGSRVEWILSNRIVLHLGLISYSLYLWHQPVFAFCNSLQESASEFISLAGVALVYVLAVATYILVEKSCAEMKKQSQEKLIKVLAFVGIVLVALNLVIYKNAGFPTRLSHAYKSQNLNNINQNYNERVIRTDFGNEQLKQEDVILIVGNSFARDLVNVIAEIDEKLMKRVAYKEVGVCSETGLDFIKESVDTYKKVFLGGIDPYDEKCMKSIRKIYSQSSNLYLTGLKSFGNNMNWIMTLKAENRAKLRNEVNKVVLQKEYWLKTEFEERFISFLIPFVHKETVEFTNERGMLYSHDGVHLTKEGAAYLAKYYNTWFLEVLSDGENK